MKLFDNSSNEVLVVVVSLAVSNNRFLQKSKLGWRNETFLRISEFHQHAMEVSVSLVYTATRFTFTSRTNLLSESAGYHVSVGRRVFILWTVERKPSNRLWLELMCQRRRLDESAHLKSVCHIPAFLPGSWHSNSNLKYNAVSVAVEEQAYLINKSKITPRLSRTIADGGKERRDVCYYQLERISLI